ncbi:hypothetical protein FOFC_08774 [Fusarium oxysporum]|nr:hypothetical protein FOFC_08774 [Fusarium oxysporum]
MEDTGLRRTHRACAPCRRKKVKCPGERPICSFCQRLGQACEYKAVETFSPQEIQNQISGINDRIDTLENKMDQILQTLRVSQVGASVPNTIQPQSITPAQEQRISEPSNSEDQELLRAGQLYQTWCHNQPVRMFRQEDFLDTLKHRDTELQLAVKMLTYRFPPGQISADKNAALCLLSASCRKLVTDRIYDGKIRLSTLQTLCLLSMISFSEGYVMQAGLDLDMANYFASGLPLGSSLGDPFEYSLCIQAISLLQSLQGSIPDVAKPANIQGTLQSANHLLEFINYRAERFSLPREPSMQTEPNDNQGILTYMSQAAKVWHLARAYAAMRIGPDSPPPWNPQSDYALVNLRNLELDCRFPLVYRFATNNFGEVPPEELQQRRDYWGPWIFIQFIHAAIPTLLNHPFLLSLRLKNFRHMIPQTFMYQSFDLISKHTAWTICYLDLLEQQQFEITDPTIAHAVVIVATIHLQHSFVEDSVLRTKAQRGYDKCMRFLDHMGSNWPVVFTMGVPRLLDLGMQAKLLLSPSAFFPVTAYRSKMHIQDITVFSYDANYRYGTYSMSHGRLAKGHKSLVVKIRSNDGFEGWAETAPLGSDYLPSSFTGELAAIQELGPQLLGLDPRSPAAIDDVMDRAMMGAYAAKAVIDMACWDILGKSLGLPTAILFGGYLTERPRAFSVIGIRETEAAVTQAKDEFGKGATTMQLKAGDNPLADAQRVRAIRAALPDHVVLWVDANGGWTLDEALSFARTIGQEIAIGVEQPCRTLHDCAEFGRRTGLPITLDESIVTLADLFEAHAAGITGVNIKPSRVGGLTKARLIRDAAVALDMVINCDDTWGSALTTVQNVLLATTTPSHRLRAVDLFCEWTEPLIADIPRMEEDGRITPSTEPGNGYTAIVMDTLGEPLAYITSK